MNDASRPPVIRSLIGIAVALLIAAGVTLGGSAGGATVNGVPAFAIAAVIAFGIQWLAFVPAYLSQSERYYDLIGSLTYLSVMVFAFSISGDPRSLLLAGLVGIWAVRLGSFLFLRIRDAGSDQRFDRIKPFFFRFLMTWTLQGLWVLITAGAALAAMTSANSSPPGAVAAVGVALWCLGFGIEVVADRQKRAFRRDPANRERFIHHGLWAWSRHPNYFGEITLWLGIAVIAAPALSGWQYVTLVSPVFVYLLLTRVSGIPMLDRLGKKRWGDDPAYRAYRASTPALFPAASPAFPPARQLMRWILGLVAALPAGLSYGLAQLLFWLLYYGLRYRRATVRENLAMAFPEKTPGERAAIARASYRHLANLFVEIVRSTKMRQEEFARRVTFANLEVLTEATRDFETQALVMLIHQGNWEWMLHGAMAQLPVSVDPVYKALHSPFWDAYMLRARSRFGATPMTIENVGREVIRGRKRKRVIVMLADQAGPKHGGFWTEFLNRPASFYRGADKLAQALKIPVLFAQCRRVERGHYEIVFRTLSAPPHPEDGEQILSEYVATAEACIAEQPETYLWTNRRWKKTPPDDYVRSKDPKHPA